MSSYDTYALLERLLDGEGLRPAELDELLGQQVKEDQYLEYKDGKELVNPKKGAATIREYVSGFANSEGGVLIIGVEDGTYKITGAKAPSGLSLQDWASDCLTKMAAFLMPPPRFVEVTSASGVVLVMAVARTPSLVPDVQDGRIVYRLRIGDQTLEAPEYLVADWMLGRRQQSVLRVEEMRLVEVRETARDNKGSARNQRPTAFTDLDFNLGLAIENLSLTWAEEVQVGLVCWLPSPPDEGALATHKSLLAHVDVRQPAVEAIGNEFRYQLVHLPMRETEANRLLKPFTTLQATPERLRYRLGATNPRWFGTWQAAVYVIARNAPATWYQVGLQVNEQLFARVVHGERTPLSQEFLSWRPVWRELPVVAIELNT